MDVREEGVPDEQIPSFSWYGLCLAGQVLHERLTVAVDVGPKARVEALELAVESWQAFCAKAQLSQIEGKSRVDEDARKPPPLAGVSAR